MSDSNAYNRPWKAFDEQISLLQSRGMAVPDTAQAMTWLQRVGYYRLSAYWYPFRVFRHTQDSATGAIQTTRTDGFVPGTTLNDAVDL